MSGKARQYGWIGRRRYMGMVAVRTMQLADPPSSRGRHIFPDVADQKPCAYSALDAVIPFEFCSA
jgi:hypothetical protein